MSKWIEFRPVPHAGKTKRWEVVTRNAGVVIGRIEWYSPWRQYTLAPAFPTRWEEDCLRDIATFIESETRQHREAVRA
jgi:hypothetical protein